MKNRLASTCAVAGGLSGIALGQVAARVVAKVGDALDGSAISTLNAPFTNGLGQVGFVAGLADSSRAIWVDNGSVFNSSSALPDVLTGAEGTMGISDTGGFVYSPSYNGFDAVYTHLGLLLAEGDPTPGMPGMFASFNSRPTMTPDGTANWIAGWTATPGGSSQGRIFYKAPGANIANASIVIKSGDMVAGFPVGASGIGFGYDVSQNNLHHIIALTLSTGSTSNDSCIWVDGNVAARESQPTGQGDNWQNFSAMGINNAGDHVITGDTDAATATDAFVAYNGAIVLREGGAVGGLTLSGTCRWVSIDNSGHVAFIHDTSGGETLFFGESGDLAQATAVATVGASLDTNNDGIGDYTLVDFKASGTIGPGLDIADNSRVYVEVDLSDGATTVEAVIEFTVGTCPGDLDGDGSIGLSDLTVLLSNFGTASGATPDDGDMNGDGAVDLTDLAALLALFGSACP